MSKASPRKPNLLLNVTMFAIVCPVFFALGRGLAPGLGIGRSAAGGAQLSFYAVVSAALMVIAAVMIVCKGWIKTALLIIIAVSVGMGFLAGGGSGPKRMFLEMGGAGSSTTTHGMDVFCNGIHVGQTPFTISREEFEQKVKPWEEPPRQERVDIDLESPWAFSQAKYTWVPCDAFGQYDVWPPDFNRYNVFGDRAKLDELLKSSRYWWRVTNDGHSGLLRITNLAGGGGGRKNMFTVRGEPEPEWPALQSHVDLMLEALRLNDYQPTEEWIEYFLKHKDMLFLQIHGKPRYGSALETAVRMDFDLPEKPTDEDCERVLDTIMERAEARGAFQIPSFESMALDLMGQAVRPAVVRRFKEEMNTPGGGLSGHRRSGKLEILHHPGPAVRLLPLMYTTKHLRPPELFAPLVYEYARNGRYFEIIASYGTMESSRILSKALRLERGGRRGRFDKSRLLGQLVRVSSPEAHDNEQILMYFRENAVGTFNKHYARQIVEAYTGNPDVDQGQLATWVYHWSPLDEREKKDLIARIPSSMTYHYMMMFQVHIEKNKREELISHLSRQPNPSLDQFVVDTYEWYRSERGPGYWHNSVSEALVKTDTPAIRSFITERIEKGDSESRFLLREIAGAKADLAGLKWLVPVFAKMQDSGLRQNACRVLTRINAPDARTLLDKWAGDNDANVAKAATAALTAIQAQREKAVVRQKQYADLLAGRIIPDDLLPTAKPWVWDGSEYVPEAN